jgi:hypothetical protein
MVSFFARTGLAAALCLAGTSFAAAVGNVTGVTASKTQAYVDEAIVLTAQGTLQPGKACRLYGGLNSAFTELGLAPAFPHAFTNKPFKFDKPGKYVLHVYGGTQDKEHECTGSKTVEINVVAKPVAVAVQPGVLMVATLSCPGGYEKVGDNPAKGEIKCRKLPAPCPSNFEGSMDSATGKLVCTPKAAQCPEGWQGGMQGGILSCTSVPQPSLPCPAKTPQWQWGSSYYKEGWRYMGCSANLEPPK